MRSKDSKGWHVVNWQWLQNWSCQGLSKETDTSFGLRVNWEELSLKVVVILGDKESRGSQSSLTLNFRRNLVVQQFLDVIDGQQMLSVHGNDNSIPNLRNQNLWLVLDFHLSSCQDLGVDSLWQSREDISPWSQDGNTQVERTANGEHTVTHNVPHVGIQEEQQHVDSNHQTKSNLSLLLTQDVAKPVITVTSHGENRQVSDGVSERQNQEEIRFTELGCEHHDPKEVRHPHVQTLQLVEVGGKHLRSQELSGSFVQVWCEQTSQRHDSKEHQGSDSDEETNDRDDLSRLRNGQQSSPVEDVDDWSKIHKEDQEQEEQTTSQVLSSCPFSGNEHPLEDSGQNLDEGSNASTNGGSGPL